MSGGGQGLVRSLVGIRGVLAALVVAIHLAPFATALVPPVGPAATAIWHHGLVALDVFFVLSGFVITAGYRSSFAHRPSWGVFSRFLWARLSRFYPLHLAVLAALVAAVLGGRLVGHEVPHGGTLGLDLLRHVTLTQGWGGAHALTWNGPSWSLSAEWFCYLLAPLLVPLVVRLRTSAAVIGVYAAACGVMLAVYAVLGHDDATLTYLMPLPRALGGFIAGSCLQQLTRVPSRLPRFVGRATGALVLTTVGTVVGLAVLGLPTLGAMPVAGLIVLALSQERGWVDAVLASRPMMAAGEVSVAVYLTHVPWLIAASMVVTPVRFPGAWGLVGLVLLVAGVVVLGWLALVLVERPAMRWMRAQARPGQLRRSPPHHANPMNDVMFHRTGPRDAPNR